jgi:hypothetical protein
MPFGSEFNFESAAVSLSLSLSLSFSLSLYSNDRLTDIKRSRPKEIKTDGEGENKRGGGGEFATFEMIV